MKSIDNKKAPDSWRKRSFGVVNKGILTMLNIPFTIDSDKILNMEDLLPKIPVSIVLKGVNDELLTQDEEEIIQKINTATENAITPLPLGISAIGELLATSSEDVTPDVIHNIGWLIESLGRQMHALNCLKEMSESVLSTNKKIAQPNKELMS